GSLTINNHADGKILSDLFAVGAAQIDDVVVNNDGLIDGGEVGTGATGAIVNNSSTGVITSSAKDEATLYASVVNNYGQITGGEDAVIAGFVHNYAGGLIQGPRHAVTGSGLGGVTVINEAGGTMIGTSGSAVNIDNDADPANTVHVINYGVMESGPHAGDGDAVDVDGLLVLANYGRIAGLNAYGYHDGEPNVSEGVTIG